MSDRNPFEAPETPDETLPPDTQKPLTWKEKARVAIYGVIVTAVFFTAIFLISFLSFQGVLNFAGYGRANELTLLPIFLSLGVALRIGSSAVHTEIARIRELPARTAGGVGEAGGGHD